MDCMIVAVKLESGAGIKTLVVREYSDDLSMDWDDDNLENLMDSRIRMELGL